MGRPQRFTDEQVLDAALEVVGRTGSAVTVDEVAAVLGCRVGAVYYRFSSRQALLIRLWLRAVRRFQTHFLRALDSPGAGAALVAAACTIPDYCRTHPGQARALTLYRQTTLLRECPGELYDQVATLNLDLTRAVDLMIERRFGSLDDRLRLLTRAAIQETPYGLVRPYIGSAQGIPMWLTDAVAAAVPAMLALGDSWLGDARPRGDAQSSR